MGSLNHESDSKQELDDSGYVQEESSPANKQACENGYEGVQLLDLSDDVLLYILKHCSPQDLKALGYTCPRLGALVLDHTLWQRVDARGQPSGRSRLRWYLAHALSDTTTELKLSGYAKYAKGCLGYVNHRRREEEEYAAKQSETVADNSTNAADSTPCASTSSGSKEMSRESDLDDQNNLARTSRVIRICGQQLPRFNSFPSWPEDYLSEVSEDPDEAGPAVRSTCPGPQFTLTPGILRQLRNQCPKLTSLSLEYCIIDSRTTGITRFPVTLKKLSLRGTKCYNLDKSFLFRIQDHLIYLEDLDLSECEWLEPESLLPLSKMPALTRLLMSRCCKLTEFVAYSSLATRYGFKTLKVVDLTGSPVGDTEVSALGWLPLLEELRVSPADPPPDPPRHHAHYWGDALPEHHDLHPWEMQEPEYFTSKYQFNDANEAEYNMEDEVTDEKINAEDNQRTENACGHGTSGCIIMGPYARADVNENSENDVQLNQAEENGPNPVERPPLNPVAADGNIFPYYMFPNRNLPDYNVPNANPSNANASKRKSLENGSGDNIGTDPGSSSKRKKDDKPCSCDKVDNSEKSSMYTTSKSDDSDDDDDCSGQAKRSRPNAINQGASTSKSSEPSEDSMEKPSTSTCENSEPKSKECDCRPMYEKFVRFRQNQDPVVVERPIGQEDRPNEINNRKANHQPKHRVLYVNVGRRLHTMYRLTMPVCTVNEPVDLRTYTISRSRRQLLCPPPEITEHSFLPHRLDPSSLVTDSAIRRFGRADGENINYVHIGPNGPMPVQLNDSVSRPDRANLRILSITGFRHITNLSLVHLATAAPHLRLLDVTGTGVTARGVENFRTLRPDCEVIFGEELEKKEEE